MKRLAPIIIILVAAVACAIVIYGPILQQNRIISLTQTTVDPQGSVSSDGKLTGPDVYWNLLGYVEAEDVIQGFKLPEGQTASTTVEGITKTVNAGATIEVDITPGQPYLIRDLQVQQVTAAPPAKDVTGSGTQSALTLTYYAWLEPSFRIYTPYQVKVLKDGQQIGSATLNTQGTATTPQTIPTSQGTIIIQNLGSLQSTYLTPNTPSQVCILSEDYIYDWAQIQSMVDGTNPGSVSGSGATKYADYWYGISRSAGYAVNPVVTIGFSQTTLYQPSQFGGWSGSDYGTSVTAVKPVIYSSDKSSLPEAERSFFCLTEWIQNRGVANLAAEGSAAFSKYGGSSEMHIMTDYETGKMAMVIEVPWGAYSTPLVNVRVPVEMADTWVERPQISDISVHGYWPDGSRSGYDIGAQATLAVDCTQLSSVSSSAKIMVTSSSGRFSVYPIENTVTLAPNGVETIYFTVSQTGGATDSNNVAITISSYETYSGALKHTDTVYCDFLATIGNDIPTTLKIYVKDNTTAHAPIVGLQVNVAYDSMPSINTFTDENGIAALTLSTSGGGGYTGTVNIKTEATSTYPSEYVTTTVKPGPNDVQIIIGAMKKNPSWISQYWWLIAIAIVIVLVVVIAASHANRRHKK